MKKWLYIPGLLVLVLWAAASWAGTDQNPSPTVAQILTGIEKRYAGKGFSADFFQESMLKAMQISDTAEGHLTVKRPGKMRWQYTTPEEQTIITDGKSLWIYRPTDNQVMVGKAPEFFGHGRGAAFLSDIRQVRQSFKVRLQPAENPAYYRLHLVPRKPTAELAEITLSVAKAGYLIDQVVTLNAYGDETRIVLNNYQFNLDPDDTLFAFTIPDGADIVEMDKP